MSDALTLDGLTADRLTATLQRKGHVPEGRIERLTIESPQTTLISAIARLRLEWSGEQIVAVYARFHAAWWDDPRLGGEVGAFDDLGCEELLE